MVKVTTSDLAAREYWTPAQAARVLGRGAWFWRRLFDAEAVGGYPMTGRDGKKRRYIEAASARAYLAGLAAREKPAETGRQRYQDRLNADPRIAQLRALQGASCGPD